MGSKLYYGSAKAFQIIKPSQQRKGEVQLSVLRRTKPTGSIVATRVYQDGGVRLGCSPGSSTRVKATPPSERKYHQSNRILKVHSQLEHPPDLSCRPI